VLTIVIPSGVEIESRQTGEIGDQIRRRSLELSHLNQRPDRDPRLANAGIAADDAAGF
jgi:hypothetical protein